MAKKERTAPSASKQLPGIGAFPDALKEIKGRIGDRYSFVKRIAEGKTGATYELKSNANPHLSVCLKTIRDDITEKTRRTEVCDTLRKEAEILTPLSHRCLPTVYESDFECKQPFYISSYHPGVTFGDFHKQNRRLHFSDAIHVIRSLVDTLRYLHENGRTHCDLHTENILIGTEVLRDGILIIDFGSGHRLSDTTSQTPNRGNQQLKDSEGARLDRKMVNRNAASQSFQSSDHIAFGRVLLKMADCFLDGATSPMKRAYHQLATNLVQERATSWKTIESLVLDVEDPFRVVSSNADIFLSADGVPQSITIPISSCVAVGEPSLAIINTPAFQRLRGLRQLSFCDWLYPGATHTRFEHSIGVFDVAKRSIETLVHDRLFRDKFNTIEVRGFLLAAILHDVGHYPFAHVIEQYVAGRFPDSQEAKNIASHEKHTLHLLDNDSELAAAIDRHWGEGVSIQAGKILQHTLGGLSELLDGPIDVDKMDYLPRDASHCGIRYGSGLEVDSLLSALRCVDGGNGIGIAHDGISAAEGLLILQDQMYSAVYWNAHTRGLISMFHAILAHVVSTDVKNLTDFVADLKAAWSEHDALRDVLPRWIERIEKGKGDKVALMRLAEVFRNPEFPKIYRPIRTYRGVDQPHRNSRLNVFNQIVVASTNSQSTVPISWKAVGDLRQAYISAFKEKNIDISYLQIVIDVPFGKTGRRMLKVKGEDGQDDLEIVKVSHLQDSIFTEPTKHLSPIRVYIAPEVVEAEASRMHSIIESAEERFDSPGANQSRERDVVE